MNQELFAKNENFKLINEIELASERFRRLSIFKKIVYIVQGNCNLKTAWKLRVIPPFHSFLYSKIIKEIKKRNLVYSSKILEVGCGLGIGISKIAQQFPNFKILAIDINEDCINFNKKNFNLPNIEWRHCSWGDINDMYDIIIAIDIIEHIKEYESFLEKLIYSLNSEGILFLSTPNKLLYQNKVLDEYHYREWNHIAFTHLLKRYFSYIEVSLKKGWIFAVTQDSLYTKLSFNG